MRSCTLLGFLSVFTDSSPERRPPRANPLKRQEDAANS